MKKQNYTATIVVKASVIDAFNAINRVSKWWTESIEGNSENLDDVFTTHFGETFVDFKIIEMVPGTKVVWLVTNCNLNWLRDKKEWKDTRIIFEISMANNLTQIDFTHLGLTPEVECFNDCIKGWDQYIKDSLFKLITEGQGMPNKKKILNKEVV